MTAGARHLVLIGLPGSGKTSVGARVAERLGTSCTDVDAAIEAQAGMPIARLFVERGEPAFRALERDHVITALAAPPHVVVPGGGWAAQPDRLADAVTALIIHLDVGPETAAARLGHAADRPLLAADPSAELSRLAAERAPAYRRAAHTVPTEGRDLDEVVADVVALARDRAGWPN